MLFKRVQVNFFLTFIKSIFNIISMVKKNETISNEQESELGDKQELKEDVSVSETEIHKNLEILHKNISLETIRDLDTEKDISKKDKKGMLKKIYPYWVYIFKDGKRIKDFGVREEIINGVKLLLRVEKINGETKVIFRELYPEPRFDPGVIDANKKKISQELNLYKQIEKKLETSLFNEEKTHEYNYNLADVRIAILEKEVQLDSIRYGKKFQYFQDIRDDGIPCLFYEFENNGFRLKKEVKEKALFTEASEVKQIESLESKRDIDNQLKKKGDKDWVKIFWGFFLFVITIGYAYGLYELLNFNNEREYGEIKTQLEESLVTINKGQMQIINNCNSVYKDNKLIEALNQYTATNQQLLNSSLSMSTNAEGRTIITN